MMSKIFTQLCATLLVCTPLAALDSITFLVGPNSIKYGAIGEVKPDKCDITVTAEGDWWIANGAVCAQKDNTELTISQPADLEPKCTQHKQPKSVKWEVTSIHTNNLSRIQIDGKLHTCNGGGNGGQPPIFASHIYHADLDVDSDNTNTYAGRAPDSPANSSAADPIEDAIEDEASKPGVVVFVNRGWDQTQDPGTTFDALVAAQKTQDVARTDTATIKIADPHLVKARVFLKGLKDTGTLTLTPPASLRIYGDDGKQFTSGEKANGEHWFYLEGVTASGVLGDARIAMEVKAADSTGSVKDFIRCTVVDIDTDGLAEPLKGDDGEWGPAIRRFSYNKRKVGTLTVMPRTTLKPAISAELADKFLGGSKMPLKIRDVDDSHGSASPKRVTLTWQKDRTEATSSVLWTDKTQYLDTGKVQVYARFTGLPQDNNHFGDKWFEIQLNGVVYHRLPWRAFFNSETDNHHDHTDATDNAKTAINWYYYWSTTRGGVTPACSYAYDGENPLVKYLVKTPDNRPAMGFVPKDNSFASLLKLLAHVDGKRRKKLDSKPDANGENGIRKELHGTTVRFIADRKNPGKGAWKKFPVVVKAHFAFTNTTDIANATWAHELTHWRAIDASADTSVQPKRYFIATEGVDDDGDGVPTAWELDFGMNPNSKDSFPKFNGSGGGDQEYYAWLGMCLGAAPEDKSFTMTVDGKEVTPRYQGPLSVKSKKECDWSHDGYMWEKSQ